MLLPVELHEKSHDIDGLLMPGRQYLIQILAFTGGIGDDIYSSPNVSITTEEGGMLLY